MNLRKGITRSKVRESNDGSSGVAMRTPISTSQYVSIHRTIRYLRLEWASTRLTTRYSRVVNDRLHPTVG